ncbi:DegV family protein with EDD domain [Breznakia sp. PF5-3]|uniref:DegV family protein n=1 Tax=unclassified Breznakia TaxID=2623764 RepID=UPI00240766AD|nr:MULTISPECIES: DegV family protein [unclassified Breznakia]MDL2276798.1 DegV family protein [Breznakia sp. OttesenSCG-928-G09]MDF9825119.1 DegV family protein with EDD domain [Breznakia sp. PM6-1]MDF9835966.1 DegV family protein with EDD domain [Breznakia sp. PF5-3]MDF9837795.1 DegV family protein with EDD domain [Breznakia sp. PFB2-8]MDF9859715.1 DegV family protein with EDD domain [Breznakia sp. PH5-24]
MKVAFVTDSGTGLSVDEVEKLGCFSVPLQISYDDVSLLENEDINVDQVYDLMEKGKMMKTSLAPLGKIEDLFNRLKNEGYDMIFAVPICKGLSGTIDAMEMTAKEVGINFDYFDNHVTAMVEKYMVVRAKELYEEGKSIDEIKQILSQICNSTNTLLVPNDLNHLRRGGRLTPFAATLGGLLKIKPILEINKKTNGKIDVLDKVRTMSKALDTTLEIMKKEIFGEGEGYSITVAHVVAEEAARALIEKYKAAFPKANYDLIKLVSVVGVHTGLGCLAIQYFKEL